SGNAALQLKNFDFVGECSFIGFEHTYDVFTVFFFADKKPALDVLRFAAGFDYVAVGIFLDEFDRGIEGVEVLVRNDIDASFLELFLSERTVVFKAVGVWRTANDWFSCGAQGLGFGALAKGIV